MSYCHKWKQKETYYSLFELAMFLRFTQDFSINKCQMNWKSYLCVLLLMQGNFRDVVFHKSLLFLSRISTRENTPHPQRQKDRTKNSLSHPQLLWHELWRFHLICAEVKLTRLKWHYWAEQKQKQPMESTKSVVLWGTLVSHQKNRVMNAETFHLTTASSYWLIS